MKLLIKSKNIAQNSPTILHKIRKAIFSRIVNEILTQNSKIH
jgi:hypothetical protein